MKQLFYSIALLVCCSRLPAQIQTGQVLEQNSNRTPVGDVQITFKDAVPTQSDDKGRFRLAFQEKKAGDLIFLNEIRKSGYELVNEKELQVLKISSTYQLGRDIILAKAGKLDAARKEYYAISDKALSAGFNREKKALQTKLKNIELTQKEYEERFQVLADQYAEQQKSLDALSDLFARVNFDDVSAEYKMAFELFESGNIDEALRVLERTDLLHRMQNRLKEKNRLEQAKKEIASQKEKNEKNIKDDLQGMQLQAQLYVLTFHIEKAEALYDQLLRLDSADLEILTTVAGFYRDYHRYNKSRRTYALIIGHPKAEPRQIADAYRFSGDMYRATGRFTDALEAHTAQFNMYEKMYQEDTTSTLFKDGLAVANERLGQTHRALSNLNMAMRFFEQYNQLENELHADYPKNVEFKDNLAISFQFIGIIHTETGNQDKALTAYEAYNKLEKELYTAYPENIDFKSGLAVSYEKLGETYSALGNLKKALTFFNERCRLAKELYIAYPQNVAFKYYLAASYEWLGFTHSALGNWTTALNFFKDETKLCEELHAAYPENVSFEEGLGWAYQFLGNTQASLGNSNQALAHYEAMSRLFETLCTAYPENMSSKNGLAISCYKLGETHGALRDFDKALAFFEKMAGVFDALNVADLQNVDYKNGMAIAYEQLGLTHSMLGNLDTALTFFERYNLLEKELVAADPQNANFKARLAESFYNLGKFYRDKRPDTSKARTQFRQAEQLWVELAQDAPLNTDFQKNLSQVREYLAKLEQPSASGGVPKTKTKPGTPPAAPPTESLIHPAAYAAGKASVPSESDKKAKQDLGTFTVTQATSLRAAPASDATVFRRLKAGGKGQNT